MEHQPNMADGEGVDLNENDKQMPPYTYIPWLAPLKAEATLSSQRGGVEGGSEGRSTPTTKWYNQEQGGRVCLITPAQPRDLTLAGALCCAVLYRM